MMKMILTTICIMLFALPAFAPANSCICLGEPEAINPFEPLLQAVFEVECGGDTLAYNPVEEAYGPLQIRPVRLLDYSQRTGKKYMMRDCYKMEVSREVFMYYASKIGPYDFERIARSWNGSGSKTVEYWNKVKLYL